MWWRTEKKEVTEFLYNLLVAEAPAKGYAQQIATRMEIPYPTLSKYWLGRRFPASLVRPLFLATDCSLRVAEFFLLRGSSYRLARRDDGQAVADPGRAVIRLAALAGQTAEAFLRATDPASPDGTALSRGEARELAASMTELIRLAEDLRAAFASIDSAETKV